MRTLFVSLSLALVLGLTGCGGAGYRVVSSAHEVELTSQLAVAPTQNGSTGDPAAIAEVDHGLMQGLAASAPSHRFARGSAAPFTLQVALSQLEAREGGTLIAGEVTITNTRGTVVDEVHISFDHAGDRIAAGEELGRRVGHYLTHREGYHL